MDLIGLAASSTLSVTTLTTALTAVQQGVSGQASGPDWITLQLVGAITSLVMALVFVHRLLMRAKDETIAKLEGGHLAILASKDETIRLLTDDRARQEVEAAELRLTVRDTLREKEQFVLQLLSTTARAAASGTTVELAGTLHEKDAP